MTGPKLPVENDYEDLYEHAPCGYISMLADGRLIKVNQTLCGWLDYTSDELLAGKRFQDLLPIAGKIYTETHYLRLLEMQGFVNEIALNLVRRDGTYLPVLVNSVQRREPSNGALLYRTTIFRSTERRRYEHELQLARKKAEDALRLRDQFLSLASHELKTPLTSILGRVQVLQRRLKVGEAVTPREQQALKVIEEQTQRLSQMVLSLFDTSRIEMGHFSIQRNPMDVVALVRRVVNETQITLDDRLIVAELVDTPVVILGDELRLEQVFQNLIQNALKYSPHPRPVQVSVGCSDGVVWIAVQDQGMGIPADSIPRLFERFYRATNTEGGTVSGMGIGLYVVKEIVELHGGKVVVSSVEGRGSTFTVQLPLAT